MNALLSASVQKGREALDRALLGFGQYRKRWEMLHGASKWILAGPGLLLLWFALDVLLLIPAWPLFISFVLILLASAATLYTWVLRPALRPVYADKEALIIEALHGRLDNQLIGSLQLGAELGNADANTRFGHSPQFVVSLLNRTAAFLETFQPHTLIDLRTARRTLAAAGLVIALTLGCVVFASTAVNQRIARLQDAYALILDALFPVDMRVLPGDIAVIRGKTVTLVAEIPNARRKEVKLTQAHLTSGEIQTRTLTLLNGRAEFSVENAQDSFTYSFEYGNRRSAIHTIQVGDLPDIKTINYELAFPAYPGQPARTLTGRVPKLRGLSGTNVLLSFAATTELHTDLSFVEWQDGSKQAIQFSGRYGHFSFTISRPERATIYLTSALARPPHEKEWRMAAPITFEVDVQRDESPSVNIQLKQKKMTMFAEQAALFAFDWLAEDDFGVAEVTVEYRIDCIDELLGRKPRQDSQTRAMEPPRERAKGRFADLFKTLNPPLEPGDRITITVTAKDNNTETGPGGGRSTPVEIVVVRPDLGAFVEQKFGFGSLSPMGEMVKIKRSTDLLVDPTKTVRTEKALKIEKKDVKTNSRQESWPSGSEDATGDYFRLLSGEK